MAADFLVLLFALVESVGDENNNNLLANILSFLFGFYDSGRLL
jgi:hypothetical protein